MRQAAPPAARAPACAGRAGSGFLAAGAPDEKPEVCWEPARVAGAPADAADAELGLLDGGEEVEEMPPALADRFRAGDPLPADEASSSRPG